LQRSGGERRVRALQRANQQAARDYAAAQRTRGEKKTQAGEAKKGGGMRTGGVRSARYGAR